MFLPGIGECVTPRCPAFLFCGKEYENGSNKKDSELGPNRIECKVGIEYRRYVNPPSPSEERVCTISEKCKGCPFPASGFICWGSDGECLRTRFEKLQRKEKKDEPDQ